MPVHDFSDIIKVKEIYNSPNIIIITNIVLYTSFLKLTSIFLTINDLFTTCHPGAESLGKVSLRNCHFPMEILQRYAWNSCSDGKTFFWELYLIFLWPFESEFFKFPMVIIFVWNVLELNHKVISSGNANSAIPFSFNFINPF